MARLVEIHLTHRVGWLRAAVLGANDVLGAHARDELGIFLAMLGGVAARAGGSPVGKSIARVTSWGALAMALTATVGALFGTTL